MNLTANDMNLTTSDIKLIGYIDSSFNDYEDRKSTEVYVFYYTRAPIL